LSGVTLVLESSIYSLLVESVDFFNDRPFKHIKEETYHRFVFLCIAFEQFALSKKCRSQNTVFVSLLVYNHPRHDHFIVAMQELDICC